MKKILLLTFIFLICALTQAQNPEQDSLAHLLPYWNALADKKNYQGSLREEFISGLRQLHQSKQKDGDQHIELKDYVWVEEPKNSKLPPNAISAGPCTNIDFESGTVSGWTQSNGFNPLTNATGCCSLTNQIDQAIMTGGVDPFGGFPRVFPGGGSFSLRLGSTATGGRADRIQQTFFVTPANANFTYRYAVVLNDGGSSHTTAQQPRFTIEMIDTLNNQIPCTFYNISAGSNVPGYQTSSLTANNTAVIYKTWTSVVIDLTPNIGQNVTIRFTAYDCGPSGHFAYAYIDGTCSNFDTNVSDTTCPNIPKLVCGPPGFGSYIWNGPGLVNNPNQCVNIMTPGVYTCQTILVPGCPGPVFTHTLVLRPNPVLSFTPNAAPCATQFSFANTSSISSGAISSYSYSFGDGSGTLLQNPTHNYPGPGAYPVKFKATSTFGCSDSVIQSVIIHPPPLLSFSPPSHCINTLVNFTNTSVVPSVTGVPAGTVVSYNWNLGNGQTSSLQNPSATYTSSGTFTITLSCTSDQGCISSLSQTLGIFPPPVIDFSANPLCDINGTSFAPITSTSIASGSIVSYFWNFGDGSTSTLQSPLHIFNAPGIYTITYTGISNNSCVQTVIKTLTIAPTPTIAFNTFSINACTPNFTFVNTSSISAGSISYSWNFGGSNSSTAASPSYTFPGVGSYTVRLIGESQLGCKDTAIANINIYPFPIVTMSVPASCESAVFTVSTTAVSGSVTSYNWNFGDPGSGANNTSTLQSPTHAYQNIGTYVLSLQIISNLNCVSINTTQILVRPNPFSAFNTFPPDACTPNYTFVNNSGFAPNAPPGNFIVSNQWSFNGLATSTLGSPTFTFPGPGIYTVSLRNVSNFNCSSTETKTIVIHPYPQATINVAPACLNVAAAFNASIDIAQSPSPGIVTSYTWNFGDGTQDNLLNTSHFYNTNGSYPITFSVSSNQGCVRTYSSNIMVYPVPLVNFSVNSICAGSAFTFSNVTTIPSGNFISGYRWDFDNDGITNSTQPNPVHTFITAGIYTVQLYAQSNNNCRDSIQKQLTVNDVPQPAITSSNVCFGSPTPFSAANSFAGNGAQPGSYTWVLGPSIPLQPGQNGTYIYSQPGIYTLQLTMSNNFNCFATTSSIVTVHHLPIADFLSTSACLGKPSTFTNTSMINAPDQITQYRWDFGMGTITSLNGDTSITFPTAGTYPVSLKVISNRQCSSSKSGTVRVYDNPKASFIAALVCVGEPIRFTNLSSSYDGTIVSNAWDFEGDQVINQDAAVPNFNYGATGSFTSNLTVTTNHGCSNSYSRTIYANPKVVGSFTSDVRSGCPPLCVTFTNQSTLSQGTFTSTWDFGDGAAISSVKNPKHCYADGVFNVRLELKSDSGCKTTIVNNAYTTVFPNPIAAFAVTPEEVEEDDPTIQVTSSASSDVTFNRYFVSDGNTFGSNNFTHHIKNLENKIKPMIVQVVKNQFGCSDTLSKILEVKPAFALFVPDAYTPNTDGRNDGFQAKGVGIVKFAMQIYDRWGHLVWETNNFTDSWDGSVKGFENAAKQDVYTWRAQVVDILNKNHSLVGHVTLIR